MERGEDVRENGTSGKEVGDKLTNNNENDDHDDNCI